MEKKIYTVKIETAEKPYQHFLMVEAEDELQAIDKIEKYYVTELNKEIIDIKVV